MSSELAVEDEADYFLGPVLGRGVTGYAYEGFRRTDGLDVVIKVLSKKLIKHRVVIERIKEDVACAGFAEIRHKNVVRNLGLVQIEGRPAVVMQQVPGLALGEILKDHGPITDRRALKLVLQIVEGLIVAMRHGLHHGDIRPKKLRVDTRGRLWITDFGMAYASCVASRFRKYANLPFGHPEYMAPEIVQNEIAQPNEHSDLYAIGITLYELVCGVVPFRGMSASETLRCHLKDKIPPPPKGIEVSTGVAELILKLTSKDPERRIKNLASCLRQIKAQLTGKDPMKVSMSNDNWMQVSASHALTARGWNASRIEPAQSQSSTNADDRADEEVMFPQGEFMSGTGFFKPLQSQLAIHDPFTAVRQETVGRKIAHKVQHKIDNMNISGKDVLFFLSVILNLILIGLIAVKGLGTVKVVNVPDTELSSGPNFKAEGRSQMDQTTKDTARNSANGETGDH